MKNHPELLTAPLNGNIVFHTRRSGQLIIDIGANDGTMLMDFPADPPVPFKVTATTDEVAQAIDLTKEKIVNIQASKALGYVVVEIDSSIDIESLKVDSGTLV